MLQEFCNGSRSTAYLDFLSHFLQIINDPLRLIQALNLLREIGHSDCLSDNELANLRLEFTGNQIEQG